jgi:thimet oligopeptidase
MRLHISPKDRTFENTVKAIEDTDGLWQTKISICSFPAHVSTDKITRDASTKATEKLDAFSIQCNMRQDLYQAVLDYQTNNPSAQNLTGEDKRLLEKMLLSYKRYGLGLPQDKQKRIREIKEKISQLGIKFQQNMNEDVTKLSFTREELEGMGDDFFENLTQDNGKYLVSLKYPELFPILTNCKVESTRKAMEFASSAKCVDQNTPLLTEIVSLRKEEAELLGYEDHASLILDVKMAKNSSTVFKFLYDLNAKLEAPIEAEIARLLEIKKQDKAQRNESFSGELHLWDWRFYDNRLLQTEYEVNDELIKEYFPLETVTKGLLEIYQVILGLSFKFLPPDQAHVWHEDVKQYEVYDSHSNAFMGHFYLDLFPRDGKYGHAAEFDIQKGLNLPNGTRQYSAAAMVANFNKPTPTKQSLLRFNEVITFFHEFGHVMHEICTTTKYYRFSGTNVERDFVEAPSQMLENWAYNATVLEKISGHYKDGKHLPDELREKLIKAKNVDRAIKTKRQLHFGLFDMLIHTAKDPVNLAEVWGKCMKEIAHFPIQPGTNGAAGFAHLVGGYSAGYYGYLWSEVYSSDMFLRFKNEGVLSPKTGKDYRDYILAPGGSADSMEGLKKFLGRDPSDVPFLKELGL